MGSRKRIHRKHLFFHFRRICTLYVANTTIQSTTLNIFTSYRLTFYVSFACVIVRRFSSERIVPLKFPLKTARDIETTLRMLGSCGKLIHVVERRTHQQDGGAGYTGKVTRVGFAFEISF